MKLLSWNVNGIRASLKKGFLDFVEKENPDILCLQETKAHPEQVDEILDDYHKFWNSAEKKGYSGTAVFSKEEPLSVTNGIGIEKHDKEGRVVSCEFDDYFLVNVYTPNAQNELARIDYRVDWDKAFLNYIKTLEKSKPVITCGDFNVAHKAIDLARPKQNEGNAGYSEQERAGFDAYINAGFVDSFRIFNQEPENYSWWSYRAIGARDRNVGWRIDYFLVSEGLKDKVKSAFILNKVMGSDHCPVGIELKS
ncbi:MAG: exodeoxyribonuclease III [Euryarchaeota archaeon]|nr:exodeoxyribonuclease III [Euryarchaeota archaeon]HIK01281.1 exodeoxyribonuclease III [Candidatus Undinarchaeales archaeon ERR594346 U_76725]|tara:strand:+ start:10110 stop:10865 length:756 start_codon:yes stop_codon:yes gene_type:complete